mgnify:FL=1
MLFRSSSSSNLAIGTANTTAFKSLSFFVGGTLAGNEVLRIQDGPQGGNVGIGRTDPKFKLDVVGVINASNILINGAPITVTGGGASVNVGNTAPSSPSVGNMWWNSDLGRLLIYYTDADTSQWVEASTPGGYLQYDSSFAYNAANIAWDTANASFASSNSNWTVQNTLYTVSNSAYASVNSNWSVLNTVYTVANSAYANSNTKVTTGKSIAMAIVFS